MARIVSCLLRNPASEPGFLLCDPFHPLGSGTGRLFPADFGQPAARGPGQVRQPPVQGGNRPAYAARRSFGADAMRFHGNGWYSLARAVLMTDLIKRLRTVISGLAFNYGSARALRVVETFMGLDCGSVMSDWWKFTVRLHEIRAGSPHPSTP